MHPKLEGQGVGAMVVEERERGRPEPAAELSGVFVGRLIRLGHAGEAFVELNAGDPIRAMWARSAAPLRDEDAGREVAIMFEGGDPGRPLVMGLVRTPPKLEETVLKFDPREGSQREVELDGERVVIEGRREIVLRCGKASLTLTRDGKIVIRGVDVLSRSSGSNRIKGASVRLN